MSSFYACIFDRASSRLFQARKLYSFMDASVYRNLYASRICSKIRLINLLKSTGSTFAYNNLAKDHTQSWLKGLLPLLL